MPKNQIKIESKKDWERVLNKKSFFKIIKTNKNGDRMILEEEGGEKRTFNIKLGPVGKKMHNYVGDIMTEDYVGFLLSKLNEITPIFLFNWVYPPIFLFDF